jgi:hypothetical protein
MENQELVEFTDRLLAKFNLYRTRKQEVSIELKDEWMEMLGKLLQGFGAQDIQRAADSCVMRLGHFPTPADLYRFMPKQSELAWSERALPEYRKAIFSFSDFCRTTYRRMEPHAQGKIDQVILLAKTKNVNPKDALSGVFKYCLRPELLLKPELLADESAFDAPKQAHVEC